MSKSNYYAFRFSETFFSDMMLELMEQLQQMKISFRIVLPNFQTLQENLNSLNCEFNYSVYEDFDIEAMNFLICSGSF